MKQRLKKRMSFLLVLSLLLGLLPSLTQSTVESLGAQIVVNGTRFESKDCPYGGKAEKIASLGCKGCGDGVTTGIDTDWDSFYDK